MSKKQRPDYYKILGLTVKASAKDIEAAALKMLHKYSPENYHGGDANARCEEIIEARDILLDENKRSEYDRYWLDTYSEPVEEIFVEEINSTNQKEVVANKGNNFWSHFKKYQLSEKKVDKEYPFLFKVYNPRVDGMIWFVTGLLIPLITLFICAFALHMGQDYTGAPSKFQGIIWSAGKGAAGKDIDAAPLLFIGVSIVSNLVGLVLFWMRDSKLLFSSGLLIYYTYTFILDIVAIIVGPIFASFIRDPGIQQIVLLWIQIIAEIIVIWYAFRRTTNLKQRVVMTLKENWKTLLVVVGIMGLLLFAIITYMMPGIFQYVPAIHGQSNNEDSLESTLKNKNMAIKVIYAITLFVMTVLVAPLAEELATRHAIFTGMGNRAASIFVAAIYFAMLHVQTGDVEHILNYFVGGLVLSSVFSMSRGNVTYDTGTHMLCNLISYVVIVATVH